MKSSGYSTPRLRSTRAGAITFIASVPLRNYCAPESLQLRRQPKRPAGKNLPSWLGLSATAKISRAAARPELRKGLNTGTPMSKVSERGNVFFTARRVNKKQSLHLDRYRNDQSNQGHRGQKGARKMRIFPSVTESDQFRVSGSDLFRVVE